MAILQMEKLEFTGEKNCIWDNIVRILAEQGLEPRLSCY